MSRKLARSVSIIGVGYSPLGFTHKSPEVLHWTERELLSYAAYEAMDDAGINPQNIDAYYVGMSGPNFNSFTKSAAPHYAEWFGMRNKPAIFHDEGCGSFMAGLYESVLAVSSGMYDCVLNGGVSILNTRPRLCYPPHVRDTYPREDLYNNTWTDIDPAYEKPGTGGVDTLDLPILAYMKEFGISEEELDDAIHTFIIGQRRAQLHNPKNLENRVSWEEEAKKFGYDDVKQYLLDPRYNPKMGALVRGKWMSHKIDGGSACIVCATDMVSKLCTQPHPTEIIGVHLGTYDLRDDLRQNYHFEKVSFDAAYEMAGIKDPLTEIDYLEAFDSVQHHLIKLIEDSGYLPAGKTVEYMREGRLDFDGDRPVNAGGGKNALGHPTAASGGISIAETVYQMRGTAGEHQMKKIPKVSCVYGCGGGSTQITTILKQL